MKTITNTFSLNSLKLFLFASLLGMQIANAQCSFGDQTTYGQNEWRGYVYSPITGSIPTAASFSNTTYIGYVTLTETFDQNLGSGPLARTATMCSSTGIDNFLIRYKMQKTLAAGYYTFTVGGDDGYRLSLDGGATFLSGTNDWTDHGYHYTSATYYHAGGTANMVLEYFEHSGDSRVTFSYALAACTSSAPTAITGTTTSSCATGTTLTATGGTAGTNSIYQWGVGTVAGQNIITGQTGASIAVHPLSTKTYWVRRYSAAPCSSYTDAITKTVTVATPAPGDPTAYGNGVWNVYGYVGADLDFAPNVAEYAGFYSTSTLGFDTQASWNKNASPSSYRSTNGYTGCDLPIDYFTFVSKRKGFPCGTYKVTMENWDDDSRLYVNGVQVWQFTGWSGGQTTQNIGTFTLDADSTIELRTEENGGDANAKLVLTPVNASTVPTAISGVNFCCKNATIVLTETGGVLTAGASYQWGTGSVVGQNILEGQTGTTLTIVTPVTTTYWVRIKNALPNCYTAGVTKTVTVPDALIYKNGAWNGTPTLETAVEIQSNLTMSADLQVCSCQVKANATVTVATGKTLTVKNKLTVDEGAQLIVENNGSLVQTENIQGEGKITVLKDSNPLYRLDYTMWSAPVKNQNLLTFSPATYTNRFYEYAFIFDASISANREAYSLVDPQVTSFAPAKGYLIRMPNEDATPGYATGTASIVVHSAFRGEPNNGTVTIPVSTVGDRFTAVGNPYASPISVKDFFDQNAGVLNANSGIYLWRKRNNSLVSSYATITLAGYTRNQALGGGAEQANFYRGNNTTWLLSQGQGFLVKTAANPTSTNITFANSMRRAAATNGSQSFFREGADTSSRLWLNITNSEDAFSQAAVAYMDEATLDLDYGYDGQQFTDGTLSIFTLAANSNLAIQARPAFINSDIVPMGYKASAAGQYKISLDHAEGVFEQGQNVYLKDNVLGITRNLSSHDYSFATEAGTFTDRFEIVYATAALGTDTPVLTANSVIVYKDGSSININTGTTQMTDVAVYDIQGRKLYSKNGLNTTKTLVTGLQVQTEVLIVEITTAIGKVSKKIIF